MRSSVVLILLALLASLECSRSRSTTEKASQHATAERTVSDIAHDSLKSVVTIVTADATGRPLEQGSGFIVTAGGKLVTNYHVIRGADSAIAKLADGGVYGVEGIIGVRQGQGPCRA